MPQFQEQKKGMAKVKVLGGMGQRAYILLMRKTNGKIQSLPDDVFVLQREIIPYLTENGIAYEELPNG